MLFHSCSLLAWSILNGFVSGVVSVFLPPARVRLCRLFLILLVAVTFASITRLRFILPKEGRDEYETYTPLLLPMPNVCT
jgi:hypothetical protein